jgi:hypothetical protein
VPLHQLPQSALVAGRDLREQVGVAERRHLHAPTVAVSGPIGSRRGHLLRQTPPGPDAKLNTASSSPVGLLNCSTT